MLCPNCKTPLAITERSRIEIDYCTTCRGVWLDRGELDKLIDAAQPTPAGSSFFAAGRGSQVRADDEHKRGYGGHPKTRRKSFLSDLFDFD
jgi:Zn-finger nucleic acid-binding protein